MQSSGLLSNLGFSAGALYAFLLVLARVSGAVVFVPLPGMITGTEIPRIVAAVAITIALIPSWPQFNAFPAQMGTVVVAILVEAVFGISIGLAVACLTEMLKMGAQIMSTQSGFSFASTIDPNTSADAGILVIVAQTIGGLLFLSLGLDGQVIRIFAESLATHPPGLAFHVDPQLGNAILHFGADIFTVGVRLAFPAIALLGLIDLSLGLLARINSQLHLISVSFPIKMLAAFALVAVLATMYPRIIEEEATKMLEISRHSAGIQQHVR